MDRESGKIFALSDNKIIAQGIFNFKENFLKSEK
jgi:hypothetical protein